MCSFFHSASGELDYDEFLEMIKSPSNMLAVSLFKLIDVDGSGTIDFSEFIRVLSTYCLFSKEDILRFTFDCFDTDGSGTLDERELSEMCIAINSATPIFPGNFKKALKEFDTSGDGLIDFYEFKRLSERYPMLTYTAFQLQHKMQEKTLGVSTWTDILKHRNRSQFIEVYKEAHQGALPTETFCEKIVRFFWGSRTVRE